MSNVVEMNPLAHAECELAEYFISGLGVRAQDMRNGGGAGGWDDAAVARLHLARLQQSHSESIENVRMVELTLGMIDTPSRYTIGLGFEHRSYAYETPFGSSRLWQAFRREGSNVGLLGLALEVPDVADQYVTSLARADEAFDVEAAPEPTTDALLGFLEKIAVAAFERWDAKRSNMSGEQKDADDARWMVWLPKWFTRVAHAADRRLVKALRAYEDVRQQRLDWQYGPLADEKRRQRRANLEAQLDRLTMLSRGAG